MSAPALNASLNFTTAVFLGLGFWFILRKDVPAHKTCMMAALAASAAFLVSYVVYHARVGSVRFPGQGLIRQIYLAILFSHTVLAVGIVPLVLRTVHAAVKGRFEQHARIARWTLPLWFYVSVTGVVIYWMLYRSPWGLRV